MTTPGIPNLNSGLTNMVCQNKENSVCAHLLWICSHPLEVCAHLLAVCAHSYYSLNFFTPFPFKGSLGDKEKTEKTNFNLIRIWNTPLINRQSGPDSRKLDGVSPVDNRPSTAEAPPIGKIQPFSKIALTLEPALQFWCPLIFRIS